MRAERAEATEHHGQHGASITVTVHLIHSSVRASVRALLLTLVFGSEGQPLHGVTAVGRSASQRSEGRLFGVWLSLCCVSVCVRSTRVVRVWMSCARVVAMSGASGLNG